MQCSCAQNGSKMGARDGEEEGAEEQQQGQQRGAEEHVCMSMLEASERVRRAQWCRGI